MDAPEVRNTNPLALSSSYKIASLLFTHVTCILVGGKVKVGGCFGNMLELGCHCVCVLLQ